MNENVVRGGAGPALAAHSKDGSAAGQTPASSATGNNGDTHGLSDDLNRLSEKARAGAERVTASVREAAGHAGETLSRQGGRAVDEATHFVRDQPLVAVAVTGAICFALGVLLARR